MNQAIILFATIWNGERLERNVAIPPKIRQVLPNQSRKHRFYWRIRLALWDVVWNCRTRWQTRNMIEVLDEGISVTRQALIEAKQYQLVDRQKILNVNLFVLLMFRDLSVMRIDIVSTNDDWRATFGARQTALLLFETVEDLTQLLGREFREVVKRIDSTGNLLKELEVVCKQLGMFLQSHHGILDETRNAIAAHREHDSLLFLEISEKLDPEEIQVITGKCVEILTALIKATDSIIKKEFGNRTSGANGLNIR